MSLRSLVSDLLDLADEPYQAASRALCREARASWWIRMALWLGAAGGAAGVLLAAWCVALPLKPTTDLFYWLVILWRNG